MIRKVQPASLIMLLICAAAGGNAARCQSHVPIRHEQLQPPGKIDDLANYADAAQTKEQNSNNITNSKIATARAATTKSCTDGIDLARKNLALSPNDFSLELSLARSLAGCQQYGEAIEWFRQYLEIRPRAGNIIYELGQALLRSRQTLAAVEVFQKLLLLNSADVGARVSLAQALAAAGDYPAAARHYDAVIEASPANYEALQGKAYLLFWTKQLLPAKMIFLKLAAQQPGDAQNREALDKINRAEEAARWDALRPAPGARPSDWAEYYQKRWASHPGDTETTKRWASLQAQLQNLPTAIQAYQELIRNYPGDLGAHMELARLLRLNGQYAAAISICREIVKNDSANSEALRNLACVYAASGGNQEAISVYRELLARNPADIGYKLQMARLEMTLKHYAGARQVLVKALIDDPQNHATRLMLAHVELAEGAWSVAQKHFGQLLQEDSRDPDALMGDAQASYYQGELSRAQASAARLVKMQPANFDAVLMLANIEHARRNRRATSSLLHQAGGLVPANPAVAEMQTRMSDESPVVIRTAVGFAREIGPPTACPSPQGCGHLDLHEDLRAYSYGSIIQLKLLPRTDSYFYFTSVPSNSPLGRDPAGGPIVMGTSGSVVPQQFLYRQSTRLSERLTLRGGAGLVRFGAGQLVSVVGHREQINSAGTATLAQGGFSYSPSKKITFDLDLVRSPILYTPTAVHLGIMERRIESALHFFVTPRTQLDLSYFEADYSSQRSQMNVIHLPRLLGEAAEYDRRRGGVLLFNRNLVRSPRFSLDAGFASLVYGHPERARPPFLGFFNPSFYQRHLLSTRFQGKLWGPLAYNFSAGMGIQQTEHGGALKRAMNLSPALTFKLSRAFSLTLGYTHYNSSESVGVLRGNAVSLGTELRL